MRVTPEQDRLVHVLLLEALGGQTAPDLTDRVLQRTLNTPRRRLGWLLPAAAAAAALLAAGTWLIVNSWSYPSPSASGEYRLVEGRRLERGAVIRTDAGSAAIVLGGYCRLDIDPQSRLRLQGRSRAEEVYLEEGSATCEVDPSVGTFAVRTEVGTVSVTGTKFTVQILEHEGDEEMVPKRMAVKVLVGAVVLSGAWGSLPMQTGQEKIVGTAWAEETTASKPKGISGKIVSVDGTSVVVKTFARGGGESKDVTVATDDKTVFNVDGKEGKVSDLKPNMYVSIIPAEGTATKVYARTPAKPDATPKPQPPVQPKGLGGKIVSVDGTSVVVKTFARGGTESKDVTVATDDKTVFNVDGKEGKVSDLKPNMYVSIIPAEGTATKIVAATPRTNPSK